MKKIIYPEYAKKRMKQRGITELAVESILVYPFYIKNSFDNRKEALGEYRNKIIKVKFIEIENYIKIITVI